MSLKKDFVKYRKARTLLLRETSGNPTEKRAYWGWHRVVELTCIRQVQDGSTCLTGTQCRALYLGPLNLALSARYPATVMH